MNERCRYLDVAGIRSRDDLDDGDSWMLRQVVLDLRRRHVLPTDLQHVLQARDEGQAPILVLPDQIAGVVPTLRIDPLARDLRITPVPEQPGHPTKEQLPGVARAEQSARP